MGQRHEHIFLQRRPTSVQQTHEKKCSTSLGIREIQFKTTSLRIAKMNKSGKDRYWQECGKRRTLLQCWWEYKLVQPLWKTVWRFLKKLKIELSYDPAIALVGIYPKDKNVVVQRGTCTQMFISAMSTISKLWKEPISPLTD